MKREHSTMMERVGVIRRSMWMMRIMLVMGMFVSVAIQVTGQDLPQEFAGDTMVATGMNPGVDPGVPIT